MNESTFRGVILILVGIAVVTFGYNQLAQARGARYRLLGENRYINTWSGEYCHVFAGCRKLAARPIAMNTRSGDSSPVPPGAGEDSVNDRSK